MRTLFFRALLLTTASLAAPPMAAAGPGGSSGVFCCVYSIAGHGGGLALLLGCGYAALGGVLVAALKRGIHDRRPGATGV